MEKFGIAEFAIKYQVHKLKNIFRIRDFWGRVNLASVPLAIK